MKYILLVTILFFSQIASASIWSSASSGARVSASSGAKVIAQNPKQAGYLGFPNGASSKATQSININGKTLNLDLAKQFSKEAILSSLTNFIFGVGPVGLIAGMAINYYWDDIQKLWLKDIPGETIDPVLYIAPIESSNPYCYGTINASCSTSWESTLQLNMGSTNYHVCNVTYYSSVSGSYKYTMTYKSGTGSCTGAAYAYFRTTYCPAGSYSESSTAQCRLNEPSCPDGYSYNSGTQFCETPPDHVPVTPSELQNEIDSKLDSQNIAAALELLDQQNKVPYALNDEPTVSGPSSITGDTTTKVEQRPSTTTQTTTIDPETGDTITETTVSTPYVTTTEDTGYDLSYFPGTVSAKESKTVSETTRTETQITTSRTSATTGETTSTTGPVSSTTTTGPTTTTKVNDYLPTSVTTTDEITGNITTSVYDPTTSKITTTTTDVTTGTITEKVTDLSTNTTVTTIDDGLGNVTTSPAVIADSTDIPVIVETPDAVEPEKVELIAPTFLQPVISGVPDFYEVKYPTGLQGIWDSKQAAFSQTALFTLIHDLTSGSPASGSCPSWPIDLNTGIDYANFGTYDLAPSCDIWPIIKAMFILTAVFSTRKLIFGG